MSNRGILQQKHATKDGAWIDRQNDIKVLCNYYLEFKSRHHVKDMQREQERLVESGTFSTEYDLSLLRNFDKFLSFGVVFFTKKSWFGFVFLGCPSGKISILFVNLMNFC